MVAVAAEQLQVVYAVGVEGRVQAYEVKDSLFIHRRMFRLSPVQMVLSVKLGWVISCSAAT